MSFRIISSLMLLWAYNDASSLKWEKNLWYPGYPNDLLSGLSYALVNETMRGVFVILKQEAFGR